MKTNGSLLLRIAFCASLFKLCISATTTTTDDQVVANPNSLLFNLMGIGTFLVFFFLVVAVVVWFLSASCTPLEKVLARGIFIFVFMVTSLVLVYAPRTQATYSYGYEKTYYDHSVIPRIAITIIILIFTVLAIFFSIDILKEPKQLSTVDNDINALWQDD